MNNDTEFERFGEILFDLDFLSPSQQLETWFGSGSLDMFIIVTRLPPSKRNPRIYNNNVSLFLTNQIKPFS